MNKNPTVSVVMATYNGEKYIREQIDSILGQSYPVYELVIQDDCSTDSTLAIAEDYARRYPNVKVFENQRNLGFNLNFQTACMRATGDFVAISDQDDVWFPEKIARQMEVIGTHDICTSAICRGATQATAVVEDESNDVRPATHVFRCLLGHSIFGPSSFMKNPKNWEGSLNYDWNLTLHADWNNGIVRIGDVLLFHRSHDSSVTHKTMALTATTSSVAPYLHGFRFFRQLQEEPKFMSHCRYVFDNTLSATDGGVVLQHRLVALLLRHSFVGYLRLCFFCVCNRKSIYYPASKAKGLLGFVRGFFFPAFSAYYSAFNFK